MNPVLWSEWDARAEYSHTPRFMSALERGLWKGVGVKA
jgi:hypothetical protein